MPPERGLRHLYAIEVPATKSVPAGRVEYGGSSLAALSA